MAKRGRPAFTVTAAKRRKVEELVSCGMSAADIGRVLGCHADTVEKHFAEELRTGHARKRAELISLLYRTARKGNVSAQKRLDDMTLRAASARVNQPTPDQASAAPAKPKALGKKEEQALAAQNPDPTTPLGALMQRRISSTH